MAITQAVAVPTGLANATGSDGHGTVKVGASTGASGSNHAGDHGSESSTTETCLYEPAPPYVQTEFGAGGPLPGQWLVFGCPDFDFGLFNSEGTVWMNVVWVTYAMPEAAALELAERAESSVVLPSPPINTDPSGSTFVNLPTWFWVSPSVWHPFTATAHAGRIAATATATPVQVVFFTGDGGSVTCKGPGTVYDRSESSSEQTTACVHAYKSSSVSQPSPNGNPNDATYVVEATITWDVTWTAAGAPGGGTLPPLTTTSTARLRVEQIESVETP